MFRKLHTNMRKANACPVNEGGEGCEHGEYDRGIEEADTD